MKPSPTFFAAFIFCCACSLLSPSVASCQDFSSIDSDLQQLENLINDTLSNSEAQQKLLDDLKLNLDASGSLIENYENTITGQENLLKNLQTHLAEMSEISPNNRAIASAYGVDK